MSNPAFSVIVPVYNASATIAETIASICAQSCGDFELILVDDGSSDDSLLVMLREAGRDERIRLVSQHNAGVSAARNRGVELARGWLIAFCDADDLWHEDKLAAHLEMHDTDPALDASFAQIAFVDPNASKRIQTLSSVPSGALTLPQIIGENPVCTTSNLVVTRAALERFGGFDPAMRHAEDQEWLARAIGQGAVIEGLDALLVAYRLSPSGLSVNLDAMYDGWRTLVSRHAAHLDVSEAEALFCRYLARRALRSGNAPAEARGFAMRGLAINHHAFLSDLRRAIPTLLGALTAPAIPVSLRQRLFA